MMSERIDSLKNDVQKSLPGVCPERAVLWTKYFKNKKNKIKPACIKNAEALAYVLAHKSIRIYPHEVLVGNFSSYRVGGSIYPELHGVPVLEDLFKFQSRKNAPMQITFKDQWSLLKIIPFWIMSFLALRAFDRIKDKIRFVVEQLTTKSNIINESGGIAHLAPDYEKLIQVGISGLLDEVKERQNQEIVHSDAWNYCQATIIILQGMMAFAERYRQLALSMAAKESNDMRKQELMLIAKNLENVPKNKANSVQEALQSILLFHIAINLESLDNGICPARLDQYLLPFYIKDIEDKKSTEFEIKESIAMFCIKMAELIPIFSNKLNDIHGGLTNGQVITVGGVDQNGQDATNQLSYMFLEVINHLRMRQPNFHARLHQHTPPQFLSRAIEMIMDGATSPALYNDEKIIEIMVANGYSLEDARNYTPIGCVEPAGIGNSLASTDAALVNIPILVELALNEGKQFGSLLRIGAKTPSVKSMTSMDDVLNAFKLQVEYQFSHLIQDLQKIELANKMFHPTPLTSALIDGCIASAKCSTAGGAKYNFSGIQGVGIAEASDSLYAIEKSVFIDKKFNLIELVKHLQSNFEVEHVYHYLKNLKKFGNDESEVDRYVQWVIDQIQYVLGNKVNTRGGKYLLGIYSMTTHQVFGRLTGALPNGRKKGQSFASGLSPSHGSDKSGPTALINSMNSLDFAKTANGINFNLKFDGVKLIGAHGKMILTSLLNSYFKRGGIQTQINIFDPKVLIEAKNDPQKYPNLLVRVSGYSAYFNDLTNEMKDELISRTAL